MPPVPLGVPPNDPRRNGECTVVGTPGDSGPANKPGLPGSVHVEAVPGDATANENGAEPGVAAVPAAAGAAAPPAAALRVAAWGSGVGVGVTRCVWSGGLRMMADRE